MSNLPMTEHALASIDSRREVVVVGIVSDAIHELLNRIAALEAEVERLHWQLETLIDDTFNRTCFAGWSRLSIGADLDRRWKGRT